MLNFISSKPKPEDHLCIPETRYCVEVAEREKERKMEVAENLGQFNVFSQN